MKFGLNLLEEDLYEPIKTYFLNKFKSAGYHKIHLEITCNGKFSEGMRKLLGTRVGFFKGHFAPDLCGYIEENGKNLPVTIEIKNKRLGFQEIFQARGYGELIEARFAFLVSSQSIVVPVKDFLKNRESILYYSYPEPKILHISRFSIKTENMVEESWFPKSPL